MSGHCCVRAGLAIAGQADVDQPLVEGAQRFIVEAEALHHAWAEAFDQDIGLGGHPPQGGLSFGGFQIQREALFAAIGGAEDGAFSVDQRRHVAGVIAAGLFNLDNIRAEVGEQHGRCGPGEQTRQVEHGDAVERSHFNCSASTGRRRHRYRGRAACA